MFREDLLSGKTVMVTGGGSGLGLSMARRFASLGANVAITGRSAERLESGAAQRAPMTVTAGLTVRVDDWTVTISGAVPPYRLRELSAGLG